MWGYEFALNPFMPFVSARNIIKTGFWWIFHVKQTHKYPMTLSTMIGDLSAQSAYLTWTDDMWEVIHWDSKYCKKNQKNSSNHRINLSRFPLTLINSKRCRLPTQILPLPCLTYFSWRWPEIKCCAKHSPFGITSMLLTFIEFSNSLLVPHEKTWQ